jgi:hypothetical protein
MMKSVSLNKVSVPCIRTSTRPAFFIMPEKTQYMYVYDNDDLAGLVSACSFLLMISLFQPSQRWGKITFSNLISVR